MKQKQKKDKKQKKKIGPSTKLIAALDVVLSPQGVIITVDDDTLYHPQMVDCHIIIHSVTSS